MRAILRIGVCLTLVSALLLNISQPAHAQAPSFDDVPADYWAASFIETLAFNGITSGCGGGDYCPEAPVTRAQMAVFLERGMNGSSFSPPPATGTLFDDVAANDFAANFIEQLAADGITAGCGGGNYCADAQMTRDQMAVFLLRAKYTSAYSPPAATGVFADVPVNGFAADWIEQLAAEGITAGCGGGNYCPNDQVTRAQMAVFLVRAFDLQPPTLGPVEQRLADLSSQYGPILYLHPSEVYLPSSVEWYIGQSELFGSHTDDWKCEDGADCSLVADLGQPGDSRQTLLDNLVSGVTNNPQGYPNLWLETPDTTQPGDLSGARSYIHYLDLGSVTDIQYWFFYPFNGPGRARVQFGEIHDQASSLAPLGEHYGDWEAVILRFDNETDELLGAFMSAHGDYTWYPKDELELENDHVLAFSSLNGHALYSSDVPNAFDDRVVHEYAGWRNQCVGGEFWGNCVGYRTDVGIGTLDVDLLNTTAKGQSFDAFANYQLVAVNGNAVPGEEWVDIDIRWGQQRSGSAIEVSNEQFRDIMEEQIGAIALVTVAGAAAACLPPVALIPVLGQAFCVAYLVSVVPTLIYAYDRGVDRINAEMVNEEFNGPKTPGAKGDEYLYVGCPTESKASVFCSSRGMSQATYLVHGAEHWGHGYDNLMGDIDGDGNDEQVTFLRNGRIWVKRYVEEIDPAGVVSISFRQQEYPISTPLGADGYNWVADFDGDGIDDIITAIGDQLHVTQFQEGPPFPPGGIFISKSYQVPGAAWGHPRFTWVADIDGDEKEEVITASGNNIWVKWYHREYDGDEESPNYGDLIVDEVVQTQFVTSNDWGAAGFSLPGDIDGDGKQEIITAVGGLIHVRRFVDSLDENNPVPGTFNMTSYAVRPDWWNGGYFWLGDIDGDGAEEVLTANADFVFVRSLDGSIELGQFNESAIELPGSLWGFPTVTWVADIDGDDKDEIVSAFGSTMYVKRFASILSTAP